MERALGASIENGSESWLDGLRQALTTVDGILFRVDTPSERQLLEPTDLQHRDLSPKLTREVEALRGGMRHLSEEVNRLLAQLQHAPADVATLQELREAGARFVAELRAVRHAENALVLETAMRDTGAGD